MGPRCRVGVRLRRRAGAADRVARHQPHRLSRGAEPVHHQRGPRGHLPARAGRRAVAFGRPARRVAQARPHRAPAGRSRHAMSEQVVTVGPVPWRLANLLVLWAALAAGATLLVLAWWGASATADQSSQVAWINVGVCGVIVSGAGITTWVLSGRRAVGARRMLLFPDA